MGGVYAPGLVEEGVDGWGGGGLVVVVGSS